MLVFCSLAFINTAIPITTSKYLPYSLNTATLLFATLIANIELILMNVHLHQPKNTVGTRSMDSFKYIPIKKTVEERSVSKWEHGSRMKIDMNSMSDFGVHASPMFQVISCNKNICTLQITDTTGSHQFPAMQRLSISKGHAFVLVYSITSRQSLQELRWEADRELVACRC